MEPCPENLQLMELCHWAGKIQISWCRETDADSWSDEILPLRWKNPNFLMERDRPTDFTTDDIYFYKMMVNIKQQPTLSNVQNLIEIIILV